MRAHQSKGVFLDRQIKYRRAVILGLLMISLGGLVVYLFVPSTMLKNWSINLAPIGLSLVAVHIFQMRQLRDLESYVQNLRTYGGKLLSMEKHLEKSKQVYLILSLISLLLVLLDVLILKTFNLMPFLLAILLLAGISYLVELYPIWDIQEHQYFVEKESED